MSEYEEEAESNTDTEASDTESESDSDSESLGIDDLGGVFMAVAIVTIFAIVLHCLIGCKTKRNILEHLKHHHLRIELSNEEKIAAEVIRQLEAHGVVALDPVTVMRNSGVEVMG